jgi:hypothetical protein
MQEDIAEIVDYDPGALIIIAGDHGPYLTKNCASLTGSYDISEVTRLDIQDRFGTLLAIRWPTKDYAAYDKITVLQDIFPAVFAYLYQDPGILEAKIVPAILLPNRIGGVTVINGVISGGMNDGEPLYSSGE